MTNKVFLATSIDNYITGKDEDLTWLECINNPEKINMGYNEFVDGIDAIIMGHNTFKKVASFDIPWPYKKPVFVLTNKLADTKFSNQVTPISGDIKNIIKEINDKGYKNLYIDGGITVQQFLKEDLIDEITLTRMPIILGKGTPLFTEFSKQLMFKHQKTQIFLDEIVQTKYTRKK